MKKRNLAKFILMFEGFMAIGALALIDWKLTLFLAVLVVAGISTGWAWIELTSKP